MIQGSQWCMREGHGDSGVGMRAMCGHSCVRVEVRVLLCVSDVWA